MRATLDGKVVAERAYGRLNGNGNGKHPLTNAPRTRSSFFRELSIDPDNVQFHPLLNFFPPWSEYEIAQMAEDIRMMGATAPFLVLQAADGWLLIDDKNRFAACKMSGAPIKFEPWQAFDSLALTVARLNMPRSHLSDSQRACKAARIAEQITAENASRQQAGLLRANPKCRDSGNRDSRATKTAIPVNGTVSATLRSRSNSKSLRIADGGPGSHEKSAALAAVPCHVKTRSVETALEIYRRDIKLFELVEGDPDQNLNQAKLRLKKNLNLKSLTPPAPPASAGSSGPSSDTVITGDCMEVLRKLPAGKYPLIIADPPYNNGFKYDADPTRDRLSESEYLARIKACMAECARLLTPNGSMFWVIDDCWSDWFGIFLRQVKPKLHRRQTIIWVEEFAQNSKTKFTGVVRYVHYFARSAKDFVWERDRVLVPSKRQTTYGDGRGDPNGKTPDNIWFVSRQTGNKTDTVPFADHPPQIPRELLEPLIKVASNPGDLVLDPFCGNGTTGRAALGLGRRFLGIERSPLYAEQARKWIAAAPSSRGGEFGIAQEEIGNRK